MVALRKLMLTALVLGIALGTQAMAQDLKELIDEREEEERELRRPPGPDDPRTGSGALGRLRLPEGEETEGLIISQDREVDPDTYTVGPGDVLQLYIWGEFDQAIPIQVDPEGHAIVPTIGTFHVTNLTLTEVKEEIIGAAQREKYPGVEITLTLESMRLFNVYLTGAVVSEGMNVVHPVTRISDLIERGGGFLDDLRGASQETATGKTVTRVRRFQPRPAARRSIHVTHRDGTLEEVDLDMYLATGDMSFNPYVRMGDTIHVPYRKLDLYIYGSVNRQGVREFLPGDTVGDLVKLGGGMRGTAPLEVAEIWRFRPDGETVDIIYLIDQDDPHTQLYDVDDIAHVPLRAKDMLFLRTRADWQQTPTVHAHGEFKYPGRYRIFEGKTTLADIVERVGGFSDRASLEDAQIIRARALAIPDPEHTRLRSIQAVGGFINPEERAYLKTKGREQRGRVVLDFKRLFEEGDESQNLLLLGGDVIFVPRNRTTVKLSGQWEKPGLITYEDGRRAAYYLEQAGGYTFIADKGHARLIRTRTGQREKLKKDLHVEPGDEIWVPEKPYRDVWGFIQGTVRTLVESLTIIVLVRAI